MKRVQRKRMKGWRMPSNTIYVGRPSKWGNPYKLSDCYSLEAALIQYRRWLKFQLEKNLDFLKPLIGKNLACFCRLDMPCHADILLEFLEDFERGIKK